MESALKCYSKASSLRQQLLASCHPVLWLGAILNVELCGRSTKDPIDLLKLVSKELFLTLDSSLVDAYGQSTNYWIQRKVGTLKFQIYYLKESAFCVECEVSLDISSYMQVF